MSKSSLWLDGTKIGLYKPIVKRWLKGERIAPITVDIALTRACQLKCVYCYGKLQDNKGGRITMPVMRDFLDDCISMGVKGVSLVSDGESTCNPIYPYVIEYGVKRGLAMSLGTNGLILTDYTLKCILPMLSYIRFNISGGSAESYKRIMGAADGDYDKLITTIASAVRIKREYKLPVSIGMQMVLMPEYAQEIPLLVALAIMLQVDYLMIKHCSDDEVGSLGVDYSKYSQLEEALKKAESMSSKTTKIVIKWSKILEGNKRTYEQCYGPPFMLQISGSGLVAPCGMFFNDKYNKYHLGNIITQRFKDIVESEHYWKVMDELGSKRFNAKTMCGCLCLQHNVNKTLDGIKKGKVKIDKLAVSKNILHKEFI